MRNLQITDLSLTLTPNPSPKPKPNSNPSQIAQRTLQIAHNIIITHSNTFSSETQNSSADWLTYWLIVVGRR